LSTKLLRNWLPALTVSFLLLGCQAAMFPLVEPLLQLDETPFIIAVDQPFVSPTAAEQPTFVATATTAITTTTPITATGALALPTAPEELAALAVAGEQIYLQQYCGICHQLDALGTRGTFGPSHNGIGQRALERAQDPNYHGHAQTAADYLMESLTEPTLYIVPEYALTSHPMPDYSYLSEADRLALVAMLLQQ
jgi:mono/diheme cytochrome c family protein